MPFIALALFAVIAVGGGVSLAADRSEPGSALYGYKVHVNDQVRAGARVAADEVSHIGATIKSSLQLSAEAEEQHEENSSASASMNASADANAKIKAEDAYNADGSLRSDLDTTVHIDL